MANAYEINAMRNTAFLYELGTVIDDTNFHEMARKQHSMKEVKDNAVLSIVSEEIKKKVGSATSVSSLYKIEKRGVYGVICTDSSIYGGFKCGIYLYDFTWDDFKSLYDARCSMSDIVDYEKEMYRSFREEDSDW